MTSGSLSRASFIVAPATRQSRSLHSLPLAASRLGDRRVARRRLSVRSGAGLGVGVGRGPISGRALSGAHSGYVRPIASELTLEQLLRSPMLSLKGAGVWPLPYATVVTSVRLLGRPVPLVVATVSVPFGTRRHNGDGSKPRSRVRQR